MQDRPTAQELVEAVASFLETEIIPGTADHRLKFRSLIAANVLSIVARELAAGESDLGQEWRRLVELLGASAADLDSTSTGLRSGVESINRRLSAAIRDAHFDEPSRFAAACSAIEEGLLEKLRVTNPRYLARAQDPS